MRKIINFLLLIVFVSISCRQEKIKKYDDSITNNIGKIKSDTIKIDSVITFIENEEKFAKVYYNRGVEIHPITLLTNQNASEASIKGDIFEIDQLIGGNFGNQTLETFKYNYDLRKFQLIKTIYVSRDADEGILAPSIEVEYFNNYITEYDLLSLKRMLRKVSQDYKTNSCERSYDLNLIAENINVLNITTESLTLFNDIGYYIQLCGDNYVASYILNEIIEKFPNRVVAYLNLGDAYWELGNKKASRSLYKEYIKKMKHRELDSKIPKHVFDRVK